MKYRISLNILVLAFTTLFLVSCQNRHDSSSVKEENRKKLDILLKNGRSSRYLVGDEQGNSMSLNGDPIVSKQKSVDGMEIIEITYNTDLMEKVSEKDLEVFGLSFIDERKLELGIDSSQLQQASNFKSSAKKDMITLRFVRMWAGKPVRNAHVSLVFQKRGLESDTYVLRELRNRSYGNMTVENENSRLSDEKDLELATGFAAYKIVSTRDLIYPIVEEKSKKFALAREFFLSLKEGGAHLTITLAAGSHEMLEAFSSRYHATHEFTTSTFSLNYLDPVKTEVPLAFVSLANQTVLSDGDGIADLPAGLNKDSIQLGGSRARVVDATRGFNLQAPTFSVAGTTVGAKTIITAENALQEQALTAWQAVQRMNRIVRRHLTPAQASILETSIPIFINEPDICNAFYDPMDKFIAFSREGVDDDGDACAATALLGDVVAHEWGHALDDVTGQPGFFDDTFSEAIGDISASFLFQRPDTGAGFFLNNPTPMRTIENDLVYPDDLVGQVHDDGTIVGATFWHLTVALRAKYGPDKGQFKAEELFFKHLVDANAYLDSYAAVLTIDDDDANPATQSPNFCLINKAFARHGLAQLAVNCVENPAIPVNIPANNDLFFGLEKEAGTDDLKWIISGKEAAQIELCFGSIAECLLPQTAKIKFDHKGIKGERDFFTSEMIANPNTLSPITIIASHYYGNKSYRTFASRDK